jgi:hypothetical protein
MTADDVDIEILRQTTQCFFEAVAKMLRTPSNLEMCQANDVFGSIQSTTTSSMLLEMGAVVGPPVNG